MFKLHFSKPEYSTNKNIFASYFLLVYLLLKKKKKQGERILHIF